MVEIPGLGELSVTTIIVVVSAIFLLLAMLKVGKSKKVGKTFLWIGLVGLAISLLLPFLGVNLLSNLEGGVQPQAVPGAQTQTQTQTSLCAIEDTTVTLTGIDKYTTAAVGGQHAYRVNGGAVTRVSDAGTLTASPGDRIDILFGNGTIGASYVTNLVSKTVPCSGTFEVTEMLGKNGTLTVEVFNEEGNLISDPENETLSAGDVVTLTSKLKGTYQTALFIHGGVVVVEYNNSEYDDIIADFGGSKTNVPEFYTVGNTNNIAKAYSIPAGVLMSNLPTGGLQGSITVDTKSTMPSAHDTNDPTLKFYVNNYYIDEDNGGAFVGPAVDDEDGSQTYKGYAKTFTLSVD